MIPSAWLLGLAVAINEGVPPVRETIVVTAQRDEQSLDDVTSSVSLLEEETLENLPASGLVSALDTLPGFVGLLRRAGGGRSMVISRGFFGGGEVEYVRLLVDGMPLAAAESGLIPWELIGIDDLESVELLRSAGTPLWGDTALGGVIAISSSAVSAAEITLGGGSNGFGEISVSVPSSAGETGLETRVVVRRTDGWRENAKQETALLNLEGMTTPTSGWNTSVYWQQLEDPGPIDVETSPSRANSFFHDDQQETFRADLGGTIVGSWSSASTWLGIRELDQRRTLLVAPELGLTGDRSLEQFGGGVRLQGRQPVVLGGQEILLRGGIEGAYADLGQRWSDRSFGLPTVTGTASRFESGAWIGVTSPVSSAVGIELGARWDQIRDDSNRGERSGSAVSPRIALHAALRPELDARLAWSKAFKAPTLEQRFDPRPLPGPSGTTFTISNGALEPQKAETIELGLRGTPGSSLNWDLALYRMNVRNEIDFDPATFRYENLGSTVHQGAELSVGRNWGGLNLRGSYTWMSVQPTGRESGPQLKNIPEHHADLVGIYATERWGSSVVGRWIGRRWLDDEHQFPLGSVFTADASVWRMWRGWRVVLQVFNLADEQYREVGFVLADFEGEQVPLSYPAAGRELRLAVLGRL